MNNLARADQVDRRQPVDDHRAGAARARLARRHAARPQRDRLALGSAQPVHEYARLAKLLLKLAPIDIEASSIAWRRTEKAHDIKVAAGLPLTIQGDADQLEQLLINLIRNAVDAVTETGGGGPGGLAACARLLARHGGALVDDEGPGLSNTGNLFVPFFTTKPGGSGIGLVLCRQIAEAHGGSLQLENRGDRRGVRATLRVPVQQVQPAPLLSAASR